VKKIIGIIIVLIILLGFSIFDIYNPKIGFKGTENGIIGKNTFIDDMGNKFKVEKPYKRIISLDESHTTNLYYIGAGDRIIGVDDRCVFPYEATSLPRYSMQKQFDIGRIIEAKPDLVIISPSINSSNREFVSRLEGSGLNVVSLMPDDFSEFSSYIKKLGMLVGEEKKVKVALEKFYTELDKLSDIEQDKDVKVFFESNEQGYMTASCDSLPFLAMQVAGVNNLAGERRASYTGSIDAKFGLNRIQTNKDEIDVYFTLKGHGASIVSMEQKDEFLDIKAVQESRVYEIDKQIINSYSFRYLDGVKEIIRLSFSQNSDWFLQDDNDKSLTREMFVQALMARLDIPTFILSDDDYYEHEKYGHIYGTLADINWQDSDYNAIETVLMRSYLQPIVSDDKEYFDKYRQVTRFEIAQFLNIILDLKEVDTDIYISDTDDRVVQKVVNYGLMRLNGDKFDGEKSFSNMEFGALIDKMQTEFGVR